MSSTQTIENAEFQDSSCAAPGKQGDIQPFPKQVLSSLMCPSCSGDLEVHQSWLCCSTCDTKYPVKDGVPLLARKGTAYTWKNEESMLIETSEAYQEQYQGIDEARDYNLAYKNKFEKRLSTKREFKLLNQLLKSQGISKTILDLPCGGGRLSPQIAAHTELLIEADIAEGQVLYGRRTMLLPTLQFWMTASAFHIPFKDESIDAVVCCRLNHHLPTEIERERLIRELLRVARRFVVMTFFDHKSLKNRLRQMRQPFNGKPPKMTMTVDRVRELAKESGAQLKACPLLARFSSGHRYALMVKSRG